MLEFIIGLVFAFVLLMLVPVARRWVWEELKAFSDFLIVLFLRVTSRFESELTDDGRAEQKLWREQQLRNLRGLALRSRQRRGGKAT